jgi:hypothetical protein
MGPGSKARVMSTGVGYDAPESAFSPLDVDSRHLFPKSRTIQERPRPSGAATRTATVVTRLFSYRSGVGAPDGEVGSETANAWTRVPD